MREMLPEEAAYVEAKRAEWAEIVEAGRLALTGTAGSSVRYWIGRKIEGQIPKWDAQRYRTAVVSHGIPERFVALVHSAYHRRDGYRSFGWGDYRDDLDRLAYDASEEAWKIWNS